MEQRWRLHLEPYFGKRKAGDVSTDMIRRYVTSRIEESASPATCNQELSVLKAAYNLARRATPPKVRNVPCFPMFQEKNVRVGFLKDEDYAELAAERGKVGLWLRSMLAVAYNYGWRLGEVVGLRVRQVDLADRTITLDVGSTKNGRERTVKMTAEVFTLLSACVGNKAKDDPVFTRSDGKAVRDFRDTWHAVCIRAGVGKNMCVDCGSIVTESKCKCGSRRRRYEGVLWHDLRRSGVRSLRRLGVSESVAMKVSGHQAASVFKRYDIIEQADLEGAAARLDAKQKSNAAEFGPSLVMPGQNTTKNDTVTASRLTVAVLPN